MEVSMKNEFNDIGQQVTVVIQTKYQEHEVIRMPENCYRCPVGFSGNGNDCGRNVPWTDEDAKHRPDTCKLKQLDLGELLGQIGVSTQMTRKYQQFKERMTPKPLTEHKTCPNCGRFMGLDIEAYCPTCGQHILIGGIDEDKS